MVAVYIVFSLCLRLAALAILPSDWTGVVGALGAVLLIDALVVIVAHLRTHQHQDLTERLERSILTSLVTTFIGGGIGLFMAGTVAVVADVTDVALLEMCYIALGSAIALAYRLVREDEDYIFRREHQTLMERATAVSNVAASWSGEFGMDADLVMLNMFSTAQTDRYLRQIGAKK